MGKFKDIDLTIKTIKLFPDLKKKLKKGTISTIESPAKKFVDIRTRVKKAGGYAMGGEASESVARSKILDEMRKRKRKKLIDRVNRIPQGAGKPKIVPKKKPKKPKAVGVPGMIKKIFRSSDELKAFKNKLKQDLKKKK